MFQTEKLSSLEVAKAANLLKQGKIVAFPTETVYGLGAHLFHLDAIQEIFQVKGRPQDNPLIVHFNDWSHLNMIATDLPPLFFLLAEHFFPGPLTLIVKRHHNVPAIVSAGLDTIALRMPSHPLARELISLVEAPLVAPSANLSGKPSSTSSEHVLEDFEGKIAAVLDGGKTEMGIESTVISLMEKQPILLRPGIIAKEAIEEVIKRKLISYSSKEGKSVPSPGMRYRHYAPLAKISLFFNKEELIKRIDQGFDPEKTLILSCRSLFFVPSLPLSTQELYSHLRYADKAGYREIWILCDLEVQSHLGLMNRITRAAGL